MKKPLYFFSADPDNDPEIVAATVPKIKNIVSIINAVKAYYVTKKASCLAQGRFGYGCSFFKYDFINDQPYSWRPLSEEARVLLLMSLNNDVLCEINDGEKAKVGNSFMYLMYLPGGIKQLAHLPSGHSQVVEIDLERALVEKLSPDFHWAKALLDALDTQAVKTTFASGVCMRPEVYEQINRIVQYKGIEKNFRLFLRARVLDILYYYFTQLSASGAEDNIRAFNTFNFYERILLAKNKIDEHDGGKISVRMMARDIGLSRFDLQKGFKEIINSTYYKYQVKSIMDKAAVLLVSLENLSVAQVAQQFGYDESSFGKAFKKRHQLTPLKYRNKFKKF